MKSITVHTSPHPKKIRASETLPPSERVQQYRFSPIIWNPDEHSLILPMVIALRKKPTVKLTTNVVNQLLYSILTVRTRERMAQPANISQVTTKLPDEIPH
jgi:hypothetical protein